MIKNAGHLPMRKNNGEDFATLIKHAAKTARHIKEHSSDFIKNIPNCNAEIKAGGRSIALNSLGKISEDEERKK